MKFFLVLFIVTSSWVTAFSQNITGTWSGIYDEHAAGSWHNHPIYLYIYKDKDSALQAYTYSLFNIYNKKDTVICIASVAAGTDNSWLITEKGREDGQDKYEEFQGFKLKFVLKKDKYILKGTWFYIGDPDSKAGSAEFKKINYE